MAVTECGAAAYETPMVVFWAAYGVLRRAYAYQRAHISIANARGADLTNPKPNWNKTPGYTEAETSAFAHILVPDAAGPDSDEEAGTEEAGKFVDVWRTMHPDLRHYTYFGYRFQCRSKGIGWRLDMCAYPFSCAPPRLCARAVFLFLCSQLRLHGKMA